MNEKELATVLAALRNWQEVVDEHDRLDFPHFLDIEPLSDDEIDTLCEKLNTEEV